MKLLSLVGIRSGANSRYSRLGGRHGALAEEEFGIGGEHDLDDSDVEEDAPVLQDNGRFIVMLLLCCCCICNNIMILQIFCKRLQRKGINIMSNFFRDVLYSKLMDVTIINVCYYS